MQKEPKLEDYGLSLSLYEKYKTEYSNENNNLEIESIKIKEINNSELGTIVFWGCVIPGLIINFFAPFFIAGILFLSGFVLSLTITEHEKKKIELVNNKKLNIQKNIDLIRAKVLSYETSSCEYYLNYLKNLYSEKIFNKKSETEEFDKNLKHFESEVQSVSEKTKKFINYFNNRVLDEYSFYILKRRASYNTISNQSNKSNINTEKSIISEKQITPDIKYRIARKIDNWDEINKKRKQTGDKGEEIVLLMEQEYLESINKKDLSQKVSHVSVDQGDGLGYDILSFFENGDNKYIEVKSTTGSINSAFNMSVNELGFLREHINDAFIYRVSFAGDIPEVIIKTAIEVLESNIVPTSYIVKNK